MQALIYSCPACQRQVDVPADQLEETVVCPNPECGQPFQPELPTGRLVGMREIDELAVEPMPNQAQSLEGERTLQVVHPAMFRKHPLRFLACLALIAAGATGLVYFGITAQSAASLGSLGLIAVGGLYLLAWWIRVLHITLTLTTRRTELRTGLFSKRTTEVRHSDVRNLQIDQTFVERLLGVGDVAISSAGQEGLEIIVRGIPAPNQFAEQIRELQD